MAITKEQLLRLIETSPLTLERREKLLQHIDTFSEEEKDQIAVSLRGLQFADMLEKAEAGVASRDDLSEEQKDKLKDDLIKTSLIDIKRKEDIVDLKNLRDDLSKPSE